MNYEDATNMSMGEMLKMLQENVKRNEREIRKNNDAVDNILKNHRKSKNKSDFLKSIATKNNRLISANNQYQELHSRIMSFLKSLNNEEMDKGKKGKTENCTTPHAEVFDLSEYFQLTIEGLMKYDEGHPFFNNDEFRNKLIEYYVEQEEYEKCSELKK